MTRLAQWVQELATEIQRLLDALPEHPRVVTDPRDLALPGAYIRPATITGMVSAGPVEITWEIIACGTATDPTTAYDQLGRMIDAISDHWATGPITIAPIADTGYPDSVMGAQITLTTSCW